MSTPNPSRGVEITGYRLSPQQRRYFDVMRESAGQVSSLVFRCDGTVEKLKIQNAVATAIAAFPAFRTRFVNVAGIGRLQAPANLEPAFVALSVEGNHSWDLSEGPLVRVALEREERHWLCTVETAPVCADRYSLYLLFKQIGRSLNGAEDFAERIPYLQFAEWQNRLLESDEAEDGAHFWNSLFSDNIAPPVLLLDREPGFPATFNYQRHRFEIEPPALDRALRRFATLKLSSEDGLAALWSVLLWKLSAQTDCLLGYESDGRDFDELQDSAGLYARVIPFIARFSADQPLDQALLDVAVSLKSSREHKDFFSFGERPDATGRWLPFQFSYREAPSGPGSSVDLLEILSLHEPCKMAFHCALESGALQCSVLWNEAGFTREEVEFFSAAFRRLVDDFADGRTSLKEISLLDENRRRRIIASSLQQKPLPGPETVLELIARHAAEQPAAPAVVTRSGSLSYGDLLLRSKHLAHTLRDRNTGSGAGPMIGLLCGETENIVIGMLGIRMAGAAFLPIDPGFPPAKIRYILEDSGVACLVTESSLERKAGAFAGYVHYADRPDARHVPQEPILPGPSEKDLEYVIYTSGTTGNPKGTLIPAGALRNYVAWLTDEFSLSASDATVLLSSYAFDLGYTAIFGALAAGARLHIVPDDAIRNPEWLVDYFVEHKITFLKLTPSLFFLIVNAANCEKLAESDLRLIVLGGEPIRCDDIRRFLQFKPGVTFVNHYGPTETTIGTIARVVQPSDLEAFSRQPALGRPVPNNQVLLLDSAGDLSSLGQIGEICIAGAGLGIGYLNRPELTAEKFTSHPLAVGERLYRTGDLGFLRLDGEIVFLGRRDSQVKIKGHRIELEGIASAVRAHPEVSDAVVVAVDTGGVAREIAAYYVPRTTLGVESLREFLSAELPDYMVPTFFVPISRIPLTPNGKIDRAALPDPVKASIRAVSEFALPETGLERIILQVWEDVLGRANIGIHDNYFSLGGDSIKAIQIVSRLAKRNLKVQIRDIFDRPTVRDVALAIQAAPLSRAAVPAGVPDALEAFLKEHALDPVRVEDAYPLAAMQQGMFFEYLSDPEASTNVVVRSYRLEGNLHPEILLAAFDKLSERFAILRTSFLVRKSGDPIQVVWKTRRIPTKFADLRSLPFDQQEERIRTALDEAGRKSFDLESEPLVRVSVLQTAEREFAVIWSYQHIIIDGWCFYVIVEDFFRIYMALVEDRPPILSDVTPYRSYIEWLGRSDSIQARQYWQERLRAYAPVFIPSQTAGEAGDYQSRSHTFELDEAATSALNRLSASLQVTLNTIFQAAWGVLLGRYSGARDVVFGVTVSGRPEDLPGIESAVGLFINTVPVRVRWNESETFEDLIRALQREALESLPYHYLPLAEIQNVCGVRGNLFDSIVAFENYPADVRSYEAVRQNESYSVRIKESQGTNQIRYPLGIVIMPGERVRIEFVFNERVYPARFVQRIEGHLRAVLNRIAGTPAGTVDLGEILSAEERERVAVFNRTEADFPHDKTIVDLFEESARRVSGKAALAGSWGTVDYARLNARANLVARWILETAPPREGKSGGEFIGLLFSPGPEMIVAILGVLKSGHAYLPLDPEYPRDRLQHMIVDSGLRVMLADDAHLPLTRELGDFQTLVPGELQGEAANPHLRIPPEDPAYVIYTSGSTGRPKGCVISHGNLVRLFTNEHNPFTFDPNDTWVLAHSYSFDFSVWEIFGALLNGGRLVLPPRDLLRDIHEFVGLVHAYRVTVLNQTPSAFYRFAAEELKHWDPTLHEHLRYLIFGGERLEPYKLREWGERYDPDRVRLINMYGITETTVHVTYGPLDRAMLQKRSGGSPIGVPLPETTVWICDARMQLMPAGVPGEIYVGGTGVSQGYLNRPELNRERFVSDPRNPAMRLYKSGDVGRWLEDGTIEFFGRNDDQVQVRGFRVEPGEIENRLLDHPAVAAAVVVPFEPPAGDSESLALTAYFVQRPDAEAVHGGDLRQYLKTRIPDYMVPAFFVQLPALPLTANNKIDRKALPNPVRVNIAGEDARSLPLTGLEERLAALWSDELGHTDISAEESFFELGGHSLTAVRLVSRIQDEVDPDFPIVQLLREPTIRQSAAYIEASRGRVSLVEEPIALLNAGDRGPVFFFPPAVGYAVGFIGLARELKPYTVYGFNFIESDDPVPQYVEQLNKIQSGGPLVFVGFSAGGSLAFHVAKAMESQGRVVSNLILLDSRCRVKPEPLTDAQIEEVVSIYLNDPLAKEYLISPRLRRQAAQKIRRSAAFIHGLHEEGRIGADIHLIKSETTRGDANRERLWQETTRGSVHVYSGAGPHVNMLSEAHVRPNAALFNRILERIF